MIGKGKLKREKKGVQYLEPKKIDLRPAKRLLAWIGLALILLGLFYSIFLKDTKAVREAATAVAIEVANKPKVFNESDEFKGFAEGFASEYLTLMGKTDNYKERLEPYTSGYQLLIDSQMDGKKQLVRSAQFISGRSVSDDLAEATVSVGYDQIQEKFENNVISEITSSGRVRLKILIRNEKSGLAIVAPPSIEPEKEGTGTSSREYTGLFLDCQ